MSKCRIRKPNDDFRRITIIFTYFVEIINGNIVVGHWVIAFSFEKQPVLFLSSYGSFLNSFFLPGFSCRQGLILIWGGQWEDALF